MKRQHHTQDNQAHNQAHLGGVIAFSLKEIFDTIKNMPGRVTPLITGQMYHVFNRGIDHRTTFKTSRDYHRAIETIEYYRHASLPVRLSYFLRMTNEQKNIVFLHNQKNPRYIDVIAYCLMPNHFHFLLCQSQNGGISKFVGNFQNSYTRYFNTRNNRIGPLFLDQFKAVRIETEEQLIHVHRYIHLNPYTSYVVKTHEEILNYPWSSTMEYSENKEGICEKNTVLDLFKTNKMYIQFLLDQADYQRRLGTIKHLVLEDEE